jgi:hypothetical protein
MSMRAGDKARAGLQKRKTRVMRAKLRAIRAAKSGKKSAESKRGS